MVFTSILNKKMKNTENMGFIKLQSKLVLTLAEQKLNELVLANYQELATIFLINDWCQVGHHKMAERPNFVVLRQPCNDLSENIIYFL